MAFTLFVLAGIGFMAAFTLNLLPPAANHFVYTLFPSSSSQASLPYLEKFEGHWSASFNPSQAWSQVAKCADSVGTLTVRGGVVTGTIGSVGSSGVQGTIMTDGSVSGSFTIGGQNRGTFTGHIVGAVGELAWKDSVDCTGIIKLQKLDPVNDPVVATVASFIDGVTLNRGSSIESPSIDESLYEGDVLTLPSGSSIRLLIGNGFIKTPLELVGPTTYTVPAPEK